VHSRAAARASRKLFSNYLSVLACSKIDVGGSGVSWRDVIEWRGAGIGGRGVCRAGIVGVISSAFITVPRWAGGQFKAPWPDWQTLNPLVSE